ncbi:uncharacterized protein BP01DRAFT_385462 [Aspergillus saccharolyticus JOP 1030-1]|uniref:Uncharacterized protein n=1 Tax=Aspergillus saccharolyticus JOP 1030-1 TaxID=1450539 RepID=A0A318Z4V8_9EURO|nr:hypothetical protein BP01DRAFT_385462 [Aspergillus saccharolyticus JOP 1030-1]PYH42351.1 hypothetical protein BP01DRAFT_385462 [Aspergillus saccharolyticus JOP 1030-1]
MSSWSIPPPPARPQEPAPLRRRSSSSSSDKNNSNSRQQYSYASSRRPDTRRDFHRYSTDDEEEVLYDLDEAALAQLPVHLQDTMRELQLERVRKFRLQLQQSSAHGHGHDHSHSLRLCRPVSHSDYAETWFKNMMARLSANQEMREAHYQLRESVPRGYQADGSWRVQQRQWIVGRENDIHAAAALKGEGERDGEGGQENANWFTEEGCDEPQAPSTQQMAIFERDQRARK